MLLRTVATAAVLLVVSHVSGQSSIDRERVALQQRVDALAQQLMLRYGTGTDGLTRRRESVQSVLSAWNDATNGAAIRDDALAGNLELMDRWLDDALRATMPGGSGRIPPAPLFAEVRQDILAAPALPSGRPDPLPVVSDAGVSRRRSPEAVTEELAPVPPSFPTQRNEAVARGERSVRQPASIQRPDAVRQTVAKPSTPPAAEPAPLPPSEGPGNTGPTRSKWSRHPAAAPLRWNDPFNDDPDASPNPLRQGVRRRSLRPTTGREVGQSPDVQINLTALAAEVRGYNTIYRELQREVERLAEADAGRLASFVKRFEQLESRSEFIRLYVASVPKTQRRGLPRVASTSVLRELIRREAELLRRGTRPQRQAATRLLASIDDYASRN